MTDDVKVRRDRSLRFVSAALATLGAAALLAKIAYVVAADSPDGVVGPGPLVLVFVTLLALLAGLAAAAAAVANPAAVQLLGVVLALTVALELFGGSPPPRYLALVPLAMATALVVMGRRNAPTDAGVSAASTSSTRATRASDGRPAWQTIIALVLHALVAFPYLLSGLAVPIHGVIFLWALWGAFLVVILRLGRRQAWLTLAVPPVALAAWYVVLLMGGEILGWTA